MIESCKMKIEINCEKQNGHMLGHHLYNENKKRAILNKKKLPSYTILSIDLLSELLREKCQQAI